MSFLPLIRRHPASSESAASGPPAPSGQAAPGGAEHPGEARNVPHTRVGAAWIAVVVGAPAAIALIIFMLQNTQQVKVSFLGMTATTSLSVMLLIAAVGGVLVTVAIGSARIVQLRRLVHRRGR